jgi:hypothetical protein
MSPRQCEITTAQGRWGCALQAAQEILKLTSTETLHAATQRSVTP